MTETIATLKQRGERYHLSALMTYFKQANVGMVGPTIAYYTLFALVPLVMSVGAVAGLMNIQPHDISQLMEMYLPKQVQDVLMPIVTSVLKGRGGVLSFSIVATIWSASGILSTIRQSFNQIYGDDVQESGIMTRLFSFLSMLALLVVSVSVLLLQAIIPVIADYLPFVKDMMDKVPFFSSGLAALEILAVIMIFNYLLPAKKLKWLPLLGGSLIELGLLFLVNTGFMTFVGLMFKNADFYKSLGTLLIVLLYFALIGAILVIGQVLIAWFMTFKEDQ